MSKKLKKHDMPENRPILRTIRCTKLVLWDDEGGYGPKGARQQAVCQPDEDDGHVRVLQRVH